MVHLYLPENSHVFMYRMGSWVDITGRPIMDTSEALYKSNSLNICKRGISNTAQPDQNISNIIVWRILELNEEEPVNASTGCDNIFGMGSGL